ncbi:hypothetical protein DW352_05190 [Pseudolabrys taiwanensis]|uniref:Uncharacterized protein n=1 Tax=Pseudolabrys taiwanensis TaxID=331696 RepID=A0A345ZSR7_9HYPH|nr:hypothetical protein [Pseudolabrys taiwanensis]AXK79964.1 hypothetical protein DW352_05190 [Pseudolabrys taiwanensis]
MSGELIELTGARAPKKPAIAESSARDLNDPRYWIEPTLAPSFVSNLRPYVTRARGLATVMFAAIEQGLPYDSDSAAPQAIVQVKICVPEGLLQDVAIGLATAAGAGLVDGEEVEDGDHA